MDDFQILSKLGEGAYSTVFKVKRIVDGKTYALKKVKLLNLSDKEKENALNEVRILASVKSNYVVSYKEAFFDEKDRTLCIVMEFADNGDLYQKIVEHKKKAMFFEESEIWRIFIQLVNGLKALHDLKILHRDLKSANVFLYTNGDAKIGDLNVSKVTRAGVGHTQTGTPYYASPEVWKDSPYDNKSDIWSLGCVLYEMIALKPPFRAQDMEGLYKRVIKGQYSRIPDRFSNDLFQIVQFLLQVNPKLRPSCEQILNHPIIQKRIEYFKSLSTDKDILNNSGNNKSLLKTIHMPKNLLFLSDKLPKPNYEKHIKNNNEVPEINQKSYRSYQNEQKEVEEIPKLNQIKPNNSPSNNNNNNPAYNKYNSDININNSLPGNPNRKQLGLLLNNNKIVIMPPINSRNNIHQHHRYLLQYNLPSIDKLNKNKKNIHKELVSLDIISKQKNELSKLMLNNNSLGRKLNYLNNNGYLNPGQMKDIYKVYPYINRSLPQKGNNSNRVRQKYLFQNNIRNERYYGSNSQKKIDYDYNLKNNNLIIKNNINIVKKEGPEIKVVPKKKLSPLIKKSN
jgi:NIMA (never in mitosis gene a)-related kinase